jgi:hypothetical protein
VHAIRTGNDAMTQIAWREIAKQGRGTYASIAQSGGVVAVARRWTPSSPSSAASWARRPSSTATTAPARAWRPRWAPPPPRPPRPPPIRAGYYAKSHASVDEADVLEAAASGAKPVEELRAEMLPTEMKPMSGPEKKAYVQKKKADRDAIVKQMNEGLGAARTPTSRTRKASVRGGSDGFDSVVTGAISEQGKAYGLAY